ncbi:MAG: hypothetical protein ACR652_18255 [Methylocystis sp.]|uniref:hypothetical protein n=1 Tax=Methylocystis sp. TaxID=1911079 RepID=UPI003DA6A9D4
MTPAKPVAADAPRPVDDAFLLALVLGLRARGAQAGLPDLASCRRIVRCQEEWTPDALRRALKAVLVRRPRDAGAFDALIEELLTPPSEAAPKLVPAATVDFPAREEQQPPELPRRKGQLTSALLAARRAQRFGLRALNRLGARVIARWRASAFARALAERLAGYPVRSVALIAASGLAAIGAVTWGGGSRDRAFVEGQAQFYSVLVALAIASAATFLAVLIWRGAAMAREAKRQSQLATAPRPLLTPDESVFRVGWVGGPPPRFLSPTLAAEIADMFAYRPGEVDPDELDVAGTIVAQVRSANQATLVYTIRRELPTILLAVDCAAGAALWNSLADEFEEALVRRGVNCRHFGYDGSFFAGRRGAERGRRAVAAIEDEIDTPGWTVMAIFGEARRLANADFALLSRVAENGPVLFLEMTDPALWRRWQARLRLIGVDVVPATALGLKDGLARVFAPDRATSEPLHARRAPPAFWLGERSLVEEMLGPALADWAAACALLQPVSFALAERLRRCFDEVKSPQPDLAYSRLAALPGSWLGPEGLKFETSLRTSLLQRFAALPRERRSAALAVIRDGFAELRAEGYMEGVTADSLARFALASACVFAPDASEALDSIADLEREGVVDPTMMRSFVARLVSPDDASRWTPATIRLADPPARAESARYLRRIHTEAGREPDRGGGFVAARWSLGVPDIRIRLGDSDTVEVVGATFFAGGRRLLMDRGPERRSFRLEVADLQLGTTVTLESALGDAPLTGLWSARDARAVVIAVRGQRPYLVRSPENEDGGEATTILPLRSPGDEKSPEADEDFVAGLDAAARRVAFTTPGQRAVVMFNTESGQYSDATPCEGEVTAIQVDLSGRVSVALRDGTLRVIQPAADEKFETAETVASLDSHVSALALLKPEDPDGLIVVASDGAIRLLQGGRLSHGAKDSSYARVVAEYRVGGRPSRVAILTDRPAARVDGIRTGVSVAVLGPGGSFDIVGLPLPDEAASSQEPQASKHARPLFPPSALLDRAVGASDPTRRVLALHAQSRRVAILAHTRVEIRPLLYDLPKEEAETGGETRAYEPSETPE